MENYVDLEAIVCSTYPSTICQSVHNEACSHSEKFKMGKKEELIAAVIKKAKEIEGRKKLACAEAFELAQQFETEITEIGRICNLHKIKICKCQLGCFR